MKTIKGIKYYEPVDLTSDVALVNAIVDARMLWSSECDEYMRKHGDVGSCVLGAGFSIEYIPKGKRSPRMLMILSADSVCRGQGSVIWEDSKNKVEQIFSDAGIKVYYSWGRMD